MTKRRQRFQHAKIFLGMLFFFLSSSFLYLEFFYISLPVWSFIYPSTIVSLPDYLLSARVFSYCLLYIHIAYLGGLGIVPFACLRYPVSVPSLLVHLSPFLTTVGGIFFFSSFYILSDGRELDQGIYIIILEEEEFFQHARTSSCFFFCPLPACWTRWDGTGWDACLSTGTGGFHFSSMNARACACGIILYGGFIWADGVGGLERGGFGGLVFIYYFPW